MLLLLLLLLLVFFTLETIPLLLPLVAMLPTEKKKKNPHGARDDVMQYLVLF